MRKVEDLKPMPSKEEIIAFRVKFAQEFKQNFNIVKYRSGLYDELLGIKNEEETPIKKAKKIKEVKDEEVAFEPIDTPNVDVAFVDLVDSEVKKELEFVEVGSEFGKEQIEKTEKEKVDVEEKEEVSKKPTKATQATKATKDTKTTKSKAEPKKEEKEVAERKTTKAKKAE